MTDTSQDAVKMHLHRLETRGGATDRADAADIIRALTAERDAATEAFTKVTTTCQRLTAERDALRAEVDRLNAMAAALGPVIEKRVRLEVQAALADSFATRDETAV